MNFGGINMNASIIGKNIKKLRNETCVTQKQFADAIGISFQAVSKWENGTTIPDIVMLPEIARYFDITIDELFKPSNHHKTPQNAEFVKEVP